MNELPARLVLLGHPVAHSLSPAFQAAALRAAGVSLDYTALDVPPADLAATVQRLKTDRAAGNVTVPHKESMVASCDELTSVARRVGAVNTFMNRDGRLVGHNTDVAGVQVSLTALLGREPRDLVVGVIGAGGAAAAVLAAVEECAGCRAVVTNRSADRLRALIARFSSVARAGDAGDIARHAHVVVNASTLGLRDDDALPIDPRALAADTAVLDLVYASGETRLVREARASGRRAADGMQMLIAQGAAAFEWWLGMPPDLDVMWRSVGRSRPA